jgi:hypothetical protein
MAINSGLALVINTQLCSVLSGPGGSLQVDSYDFKNRVLTFHNKWQQIVAEDVH